MSDQNQEIVLGERLNGIEKRLQEGDILFKEVVRSCEMTLKLYNKMFLDNGTPCFQTTIDRLKIENRFILWLLGVIFLILLSGLITFIVK